MKTEKILMNNAEIMLTEDVIEMARGLVSDVFIDEAERIMDYFEPVIWKGMTHEVMGEHLLAIRAVLNMDDPVVDLDDLEMTDDEDRAVERIYDWLGYGHIDKHLTLQDVLKIYKRILTGIREGDIDPSYC